MEIITKQLKDIKPYEKNPRKNDEAVEYVANSIREFGFKVPIVIDKDGIIVAGHTRYKASKKLNLTEVPCIVADDLTEEQIRAYRLADNRVAEKSEWDMNALDAELAEIVSIDMGDFDFDLGFDDSDEFVDSFALPDGEKNEICQMTFTLHETQKSLIEYAITNCSDFKETFGNTNKNGNALYEVIRQWAELKK